MAESDKNNGTGPGKPPEEGTEKPQQKAARVKVDDIVELHCADGQWRNAKVTKVRRDDRIDLEVELANPLVITNCPLDPTGKAGDCWRPKAKA